MHLDIEEGLLWGMMSQIYGGRAKEWGKSYTWEGDLKRWKKYKYSETNTQSFKNKW